MAVPPIVAGGQPSNNAPAPARWLRVAWLSAAMLTLALPVAMLTGLLDVPSHFALVPAIALLFAAIEVGPARSAAAPPEGWSRLAVRLLLGLLVMALLSQSTAFRWCGPALLGVVVILTALGGSRSQLLAACVTVAGALAIEHVVLVTLWEPEALVHRPYMSRTLGLGLGLFPFVGLAVYRTATRFREAEARARAALGRLKAAEGVVRTSQLELRHVNEQLQMSIDRQTRELDDRNRYLSIINAVSFALSEPMDDERTLERTARLVARLLGVRAAQAYLPPTEDALGEHIFVTVAPDDASAPRLPEERLRDVAATGTPATASASPEGPSAGEDPTEDASYAIVPLMAKGRPLGALAMIAGPNQHWDERERHLLLLIGREVGVALDNARLYRRAVEKAGREELLGEITRLLNGARSRDRALDQALALAGEALGVCGAAYVRIPAGRRTAEVDAVVALKPRITEHAAVQRAIQSSWTLAADRWDPVVLEDEDLSAGLLDAGVSTLVVAPVIAARGGDVEAVQEMAGALVLLAGPSMEWSAEHTTLVGRIAAAFARRAETDHLVELQERRIRELGGLARVASVMQSGADAERLYSGFAQALFTLISYRSLTIARVGETGELTTVPAYGEEGRAQPSPGFTDDDARHAWFALRSPLLWTRALGAPPSFAEQTAPFMLVIPMRPKGQSIGLVVVALGADPGVSQTKIVEQGVEQLGLALNSAALYQQATERASHIQTLSNLARIVASVVDLREAFDAFAEELRWLIPFERAVMLLIDNEQATVSPYATYPEEPDTDAAPVPLAGSLAAIPYDSGAPVALQRGDARLAPLDWSVFGPNVREVAAVPVRRGAETIAVFALVHESDHGYESSDLEALEEVAGLLAVTIERLQLYRDAEYNARHDLLTGLPNYRYLQERLQRVETGDPDHPTQTAVLMADMDEVKLFNDVLGHEAGDQVIRIVANVLRDSCRGEDFVARTGGDEFVLVMEGVGEEEARMVAERIHRALESAHNQLPGAPTGIRVSLGIALSPDDGTTSEELLHAADKAMYDAKFSGGHRTRLARDAGGGVTRARGSRPSRIVELLVSAATDGASAQERWALALAQRYVLALGRNRGLDDERLTPLRMLVAAYAARRIAEPRAHEDQRTARLLLGALDAEWRTSSPESAHDLIEAARLLTEIAWMQIPGAHGAPLDAAEACIEVARSIEPAESALMLELDALVRSDEVERRQARYAA